MPKLCLKLKENWNSDLRMTLVDKQPSIQKIWKETDDIFECNCAVELTSKKFCSNPTACSIFEL